MSVLCCLWHGVQLRLLLNAETVSAFTANWSSTLWDGSYNKGVLVLLSIRRYVTELEVMLAAGSCICSCKDCHPPVLLFYLYYSEETCQPNLAAPFLERLPL